MSPNPNRWLRLARAAWLVLVLSTLALHFAAIGVRVLELRQVCVEPEAVCHTEPERYTAADVVELEAAGLSLPGYAALQAAKWLIFSGLWMAVGALIFARRSDEVIGLVAAYFLLTFPSQWDYLDLALARAFPVLSQPGQVLRTLSALSTLLFVALFPNGRFVPRWSRWVTLAWVLLPVRLPAGWALSAVWNNALQVANVAGLSALVLAQVIRYRRYSTALERQRTRWVLFGLCLSLAFLAVMVGLALTGLWLGPGSSLWDGLASQWIYQVVVALIPLSIGLAILRTRLWDIDLIIRRTLIYSTLSALLAAAYFGGVVILQPLLTRLTGQGSALATVLSTLAVAALFGPLRSRVQRAIDRRFYRRKYDAARTLAAFGEQARDETDLGRLSERLREVVQETMQPDSVGLWLKGTGKR